ncbi:MAG TPA: hypothetical protein VEB43_16260 [Anaeromyxobacter sp.]|nr:hypothetical protein [Anaeromyxobacter sp.]
MNTISRIVCAALFAVPMVASAAGTRVTLAGMKGDFGDVVAQLAGDPLEKKKVEWKPTGKGNYDQFLERAALIDAGLVVSEAFTQALTDNLKGYARSFAAEKATDEAVKEIVADTPPEKLSEQQSVALLTLKKKQEKLNGEETAFVAKSLLSAAVVTTFLAKVPNDSKALAQTGAGLVQTVPSDFKGLQAVKAPIVTASLKEAGSHLQDAGTRAPEIAKGLARLVEGLKSLQ